MKPALNDLLARLRERGFEPLGPRVKNDTLVYEPLERIDQLPQGYITEQDAGRFCLVQTGHPRYFDLAPSAQSWKQFLFPPRLDLFTLRKKGQSWEIIKPEPDEHNYAFIGVRACELAAIAPDIVKNALRLKKIGNEILRLIGGRSVHPVNVCVGGFYSWPEAAPLKALLSELEWGLKMALDGVKWAIMLPYPELEIDRVRFGLQKAAGSVLMDTRRPTSKNM